MDLRFDLGLNVPTAMFAVHVVVAGFFGYLASVNVGAGETIGVVLNLLIGGMLVAVGITAARITARR